MSEQNQSEALELLRRLIDSSYRYDGFHTSQVPTELVNQAAELLEGATNKPGQDELWFCYDGCSFETHNSEREARESAEAALKCCSDEAMDGWPEEVYQICWGKVIQQATVTVEREKTDEDYVSSDIDLIQEIELR